MLLLIMLVLGGLIRMLFRTHIIFAFLIYLILDYFLFLPFWVLFFILVGAIFVDIDVGNSKAGNRWYFRPLQWVIKHRGVLHSLLVALFLSLLIGIFNLWGCFGFFVGYISHLFLDCFTIQGVQLFWPFKFRIKGFIRSGKLLEYIIFSLFLLLVIFFFYRKFFD